MVLTLNNRRVTIITLNQNNNMSILHNKYIIIVTYHKMVKFIFLIIITVCTYKNMKKILFVV